MIYIFKPQNVARCTPEAWRNFGGEFLIYWAAYFLQVKCAECGYESNTTDPFLDISLEINRAQTLEKALDRFTANEYLDGGNKYKCPRHASLVRAVKRMAIEKAPNVLCIHFKRFEYSMYGQKITKKVQILYCKRWLSSLVPLIFIKCPVQPPFDILSNLLKAVEICMHTIS